MAALESSRSFELAPNFWGERWKMVFSSSQGQATQKVAAGRVTLVALIKNKNVKNKEKHH